MNKVFGFWRITISIGWARSLTWAVTTTKEQRIFLLSLHIINRNGLSALGLIIGPIALTFGFVL